METAAAVVVAAITSTAETPTKSSEETQITLVAFAKTQVAKTTPKSLLDQIDLLIKEILGDGE